MTTVNRGLIVSGGIARRSTGKDIITGVGAHVGRILAIMVNYLTRKKY